jgi:spore germination protein YaaH
MRRVIAAALTVGAMQGCAATALGPTPVPSVTWLFGTARDLQGDSTFAGSRIDVAVSGRVQLDSMSGLPSITDSVETSGVAATWRFALVTTRHGPKAHPAMVRRVAENPRALALTASRLAHIASTAGYRGLVFDIAEQSKADLPLTLRFLSALADSARRRGVTTIGMVVPAADTASYPTRAFVPAADVVVVQLGDEHWPGSAPGAVATPAWVRRTLGIRVAEVGADRVVAALPLYGYVWRNGTPGQLVSVAAARRLASEASIELVRDPSSESLHAVRPGSWNMWVSDRVQVDALTREVRGLGVRQIGIWVRR